MGLVTTPLTGWYQGAKHALEAVSDALRVEVAGDGIHVALVEPGGFRTSIWEDMERDMQQRGDSRFGAAYRRSQQGMKLSSPIMGEPASAPGSSAPRSRRAIRRPRYLVGIDARALVDDGPVHADLAEGSHHAHRARLVTWTRC